MSSCQISDLKSHSPRFDSNTSHLQINQNLREPETSINQMLSEAQNQLLTYEDEYRRLNGNLGENQEVSANRNFNLSVQQSSNSYLATEENNMRHIGTSSHDDESKLPIHTEYLYKFHQERPKYPNLSWYESDPYFDCWPMNQEFDTSYDTLISDEESEMSVEFHGHNHINFNPNDDIVSDFGIDPEESHDSERYVYEDNSNIRTESDCQHESKYIYSKDNCSSTTKDMDSPDKKVTEFVELLPIDKNELNSISKVSQTGKTGGENTDSSLTKEHLHQFNRYYQHVYNIQEKYKDTNLRKICRANYYHSNASTIFSEPQGTFRDMKAFEAQSSREPKTGLGSKRKRDVDERNTESKDDAVHDLDRIHGDEFDDIHRREVKRTRVGSYNPSIC